MVLSRGVAGSSRGVVLSRGGSGSSRGVPGGSGSGRCTHGIHNVCARWGWGSMGRWMMLQTLQEGMQDTQSDFLPTHSPDSNRLQTSVSTLFHLRASNTTEYIETKPNLCNPGSPPFQTHTQILFRLCCFFFFIVLCFFVLGYLFVFSVIDNFFLYHSII